MNMPMRNKTIVKRLAALCMLAALLGASFAGCAAKDGDAGAQTVKSLDDLRHSDIGVLTGANFAEHVKSALPEANILYYNTVADEANAVKSGKAAAAALDEPTARNIMAQDDSLTMLDEMLEAVDYGFAFAKTEDGEALCRQLSEFIIKIRNDGSMGSMQKKWFDAADLSSVELFDYRELPDQNGTLRLAIIQNPPFSFTRDDGAAGYEIELFSTFCREYGYALTVTDVNMDALLASVQSGKFDAACGGLSITQERKESMLFCEPIYSGGTVLLVKKDNGEQSNVSFFASIASSFEKTFIREDR